MIIVAGSGCQGVEPAYVRDNRADNRRGGGAPWTSAPCAVRRAWRTCTGRPPRRSLTLPGGTPAQPRSRGGGPVSSGQEHAHEITSPGRPETVGVAGGVYAYVQPDGTWWINNTGFVTGPQGVFSIDACPAGRRTRAYLAAIRKVTAAPVRTVLNTHHHGDHTSGNALFPAATIVAHERARAGAIAAGPARELPFRENPDWGEPPSRPSSRSPARSRCTPGTRASPCGTPGRRRTPRTTCSPGSPRLRPWRPAGYGPSGAHADDVGAPDRAGHGGGGAG